MFAFFTRQSIAQVKTPVTNNEPPGKNNLVGLNGQVLFGEFGETHTAGIGLYYVRAKHRLGILQKIPAKKIGLCLEGGTSFYLGKNEDVGASDVYHYPNLFFIYTYGGAIWNPLKNAHVRLVAGPGLGFYDNSTRFNIGFNTGVTWFLKDQFGISTDFRVFKESNASGLASLTLGIVYSF